MVTMVYIQIQHLLKLNKRIIIPAAMNYEFKYNIC